MRTLKTKDRSKLIQAAMGKIPCDLTIGNVQFLNVITGEIYPAEDSRPLSALSPCNSMHC